MTNPLIFHGIGWQNDLWPENHPHVGPGAPSHLFAQQTQRIAGHDSFCGACAFWRALTDQSL